MIDYIRDRLRIDSEPGEFSKLPALYVSIRHKFYSRLLNWAALIISSQNYFKKSKIIFKSTDRFCQWQVLYCPMKIV